jgi:hypothetical protein
VADPRAPRMGMGTRVRNDKGDTGVAVRLLREHDGISIRVLWDKDGTTTTVARHALRPSFASRPTR